MKSGIIAFAVLAVFAGLAVAGSFTAPISDVTIYGSNAAYVMRYGNAELGQGSNYLALENFSTSADIGTLDAFGNGVSVAEYKRYIEETRENRSRFLTVEELLNKSVGKSVTIITERGQESGKLVWYATGFVGLASNSGGSLLVYRIEDIRQLIAPAAEYEKSEEIKNVKNGLGVTLDAEKGGAAKIGLGYVDYGASWSAGYRVRLSSDSPSGILELSGFANVQNSMYEDWENASLRVVVGSPYMTRNYMPYRSYYLNNMKAQDAYEMVGAASPAPSAPDVGTSDLSNYYVYSLNRKVTLKNGESASVPLLNAKIAYVRENVWDTDMVAPQRVLKFNNTASAPLASGVASVYLGTEFLGQASAAFAGRGNPVEFAYASMPEFTVKKELSQETSVVGNARITAYLGNLTIKNGGSKEEEVVVREQMNYGDKVEFVSSDAPSSVKPGNVIEWRVKVPAGVEKKIAYEYRTIYYQQKYY